MLSVSSPPLLREEFYLARQMTKPLRGSILGLWDTKSQQWMVAERRTGRGGLHRKELRFTPGGNERLEMEEQGEKTESQELMQISTGHCGESIWISWGM